MTIPTPSAAEIERLACKIEGLREALREAFDMATQAPELNMSNYDEEQVRELNDAMIALFFHLDRALSQSPADVLARCEAERELLDAARAYGACESDENVSRLERALAALAEQEGKGDE